MSPRSETDPIILLGFMGAGKTTVGEALSQRLGWDFIDLDHQIETLENRSIPDIFHDSGEAGFRRCESAALISLCNRSPFVLSTGGGIVTLEENWPLLRNLGKTVFLQTSFEAVLDRIGAGEGRPLAQKGQAHLFDLFSRRQHLYALADFTVPTDGLTVVEVCDAILGRIHSEGENNA